MQRKELRELVKSGEFIAGIYNYCDRWCERCPFTSRCLVFATERADDVAADPEAHDINSARFWSRLESMFKEAIDDEVMAGRDEQRQDAKQHELSLTARRYAEMVQQWFTDEFAVEQQVHDDTTGKSKNTEDDIDVSDAIEVIRWYQFFVAAKVFRALMGLEEQAIDEELRAETIFGTDDDQDVFDAAANDDADGSAKIALIAIDRSLAAWRVLSSAVPEKSDSIVPMFVELERLRRGAEQTFPRARGFMRPGFDEVMSDLVS